MRIMNRTKIGILLSMIIMVCFSSCKEQKVQKKLMINEVLIDNQADLEDDYGVHNGWIEIFNKSYGSTNLAACLIKVSSTPGDTATYFIPKGDVLTLVKPRQHALFWADNLPNRGTFHTNFKLDSINSNWIGLYDSGKNLLDEVTVPAGVLKTNQSYARISDGDDKWEIKTGSKDKYVTPSTNNKTLDKNAKQERFQEDDQLGIGMSITAMTVVFIGLILLYIAFKFVGNISVKMTSRNAMKVSGITDEKDAKNMKEAPGEIYAAISMAMHEIQNEVHDNEDTVLTITRVKRSYSPWSSKIYTLREIPRK